MGSFKICRCLVVTICMVVPLLCAAQEVSYLSFEVPGALGTFPMGINASAAVTGYYYVSPTVTRGFVRGADGTITTFSVRDGVQTVPESINEAGEITGFYEVAPGAGPHGFLRYADGQIIRFDPACEFIPYGNFCYSVPASINAFGVIAGNHSEEPTDASAGFTRSQAGAFKTIAYSSLMHYFSTYLTGLNAGGATVGYFPTLNLTLDATNETSFLLYPSGYLIQFSVPSVEANATEATVAESINGDGVIAGWYGVCSQPSYCQTAAVSGGFVRSPGGEFTLFNPPGPIVTTPEAPDFGTVEPPLAPHRLSINAEGSITGSYTDTAGAQHGFVRNPYGTITGFDPPKGGQTTATSINDSGVIAGSYFYEWNNQVAQGFLRVPNP